MRSNRNIIGCGCFASTGPPQHRDDVCRVHKYFTETELTIYGPPRVGAFDRLKISTVNKAKYDQPNAKFFINFEFRPSFKHARKNKRGTELPEDA